MIRKLFSKISRRMLGFIAFIATGVGMIISTLINDGNFYKVEILIIFVCFFAISVADYYKKLEKTSLKLKFDKRKVYALLSSLIGATFTWFINHKMGYGPVVANGLVGIMAATFLPNDLAGLTYTSSFVGMSSLEVIPSVGVAALGGLTVSIIMITTSEIYAGIGGKGGTTAALSTIITKTILRIFS